MPMIKQASRAIEHMTARERRIQRAKYARRNKMHYIDKLLNELEMLNLADQRQMPPVLSVAINKVIEESPEVTVLAQAKPASVEPGLLFARGTISFGLETGLNRHEQDKDGQSPGAGPERPR